MDDSTKLLIEAINANGKRIDSVDKRGDSLEEQIKANGKRMDSLDKRMDSLEEHIKANRELIKSNKEESNRRFDHIEEMLFEIKSLVKDKEFNRISWGKKVILSTASVTGLVFVALNQFIDFLKG